LPLAETRGIVQIVYRAGGVGGVYSVFGYT
jgi:hypothetical protein